MLRNIAFNLVEVVVSTVSVFVLFPRLSAALGVDQYGIWLLLNAAVAYFGLLMLGIPLSTVRYVTKYQAENNSERMKAVVNTAILVYGAMAVLVVLAGGLLVIGIDRLVVLPVEFLPETRWAVLILVLTSAATFPFLVFESILHAFQRFAVVGAIKVGATSLRFALTLLLVDAESGLPMLALLVALSSLVQLSGYYLYIRAHIPGFEFRPWNADRSALRAITGYSIAVLAFAFASRLSFGTDALVIANRISSAAVVEYSVGANFFVYLTMLATAVSQVIMPRVSLLHSSGYDRVAFARTVIKYSQAAAYVSILAGGGLYFLGAEFIGAWMGQHFVETSFPVTTILLASYVPFLVQRAAAYPVLMGTSRMNVLAAITMVTAMLNLGMSVWLAPRLGIRGVAWGTTVPTLISVAAVTWCVARVIGVPVLQYVTRAFLAPVATIPVFVVTALGVKHALGRDLGLGGVLTAAALVTMLYGLVAVLVFTGGRPGQALRLSKQRAPQVIG